MTMLQIIRISKRSAHVALLLVFGLLNGLYIQSITVMPSAASHLHSAMVSQSDYSENSTHAMHEVAKTADCGSDAFCKIQCSWHCQLSQAMQPISGLMTARTQIAIVLPAYYSAIQPKSWLDLKLRPPIST